MDKTIPISPLHLSWLSGVLKLDDSPELRPDFEALLGSLPCGLCVFPAGTTVITEGEIGSDLYIVYKGELVVSRRSMGGPETEVGRLKSGDFCGEMAFLLRTPRFATVRTVSECELFKFRSGDFERLLQKSPHLAGMLRQTVSRRFGEIFSADK